MSGRGHAAPALVHGGRFTGACRRPVLPHLSTACLTPGFPGRVGRPGDLTTPTV